MADKSLIEWTDATWNPITGCTVVSPGCTNCYAMKLAGTRLKHHPSRAGLTIDSKGGPVWNGKVRFNERTLFDPFNWKRPRMIFVCAHGDLFHESVPDEWIDQIFAIMALCPHHTFQVLTKRADRMRGYLARPRVARRIYETVCDLTLKNELNIVLIAPGVDERFAPAAPRVHLDIWPLPNVWLGVSVEDQARADERVPDLLATPAIILFLSAEPLLGPIDFYRTSAIMRVKGHPWRDGPILQKIHWVIVGGESGIGARPMHPAWARQLRDDCKSAGVPLFFKQWGAFRPLNPQEHMQACGATLVGSDPYDRDGYMLHVGKKAAGRLLDGIEHNGMPGRWSEPL